MPRPAPLLQTRSPLTSCPLATVGLEDLGGVNVGMRSDFRLAGGGGGCAPLALSRLAGEGGAGHRGLGEASSPSGLRPGDGEEASRPPGLAPGEGEALREADSRLVCPGLGGACRLPGPGLGEVSCWLVKPGEGGGGGWLVKAGEGGGGGRRGGWVEAG